MQELGVSYLGDSGLGQAGAVIPAAQTVFQGASDLFNSVFHKKRNYGPNNYNTAPNNAVSVFDNGKYLGKYLTLYQSTPNLQSTGFDKAIDSIKIPPGFTVTVYTGPNYSGQSQTFTTDVYNLANPMTPFHDSIQSIKISGSASGANIIPINSAQPTALAIAPSTGVKSSTMLWILAGLTVAGGAVYVLKHKNR